PARQTYSGERLEVGGDIERVTTRRDPARQIAPGAGYLPVPGPHPGQTGNPRRAQAVAGECPDQDLLQVPEVARHVTPVRAQVQNRIPDQLAGPVVGDLTAPTRVGDRHTPLPERRLAEQDVLAAGIPAQRDHRRVLEEEEVLLPAPLHEAGALVLERRRFGVIDAPEELVVAATHQTISVNFP